MWAPVATLVVFELGVPVLTALPVKELETEPLAVTECVCPEDATEDVPDGPPVVT